LIIFIKVSPVTWGIRYASMKWNILTVIIAGCAYTVETAGSQEACSKGIKPVAAYAVIICRRSWQKSHNSRILVQIT
jgi:hypothetical protein